MYSFGEKTTTLGPFFTLLVLSALERTHSDAPQGVASHDSTQPAEAMQDTLLDLAEGQGGPVLTHQSGVKLGPFLTLILTLHRHARMCGTECRQDPAIRLVSISAVH